MRVGIDAHMVGGHETGNETYVRGLIDGFKALGDAPDLLVYNIGAPWTEPTTHVRFQALMTASPYVRLGLELPLRSLGQRLDVLHMTYAAPLWSAAPMVLTVHDICYATNPEWFSERDLSVLRQMPMSLYIRGAHAAASGRRIVAVDRNIPVRCGDVTVLPGDILLGDAEGVLVIPRSVAEQVTSEAAATDDRELFLRRKIEQGASIYGIYPPNEAALREYEEQRRK